MKIRNLAVAATAIALVATPVFAEAPSRAAAPVYEASEMRGRGSALLLGLIALAAIIAAIIIATRDDNDPVSP